MRAHQEFWGTLPYDRYVFINLITEAGGGLEHGRSLGADDQPLGHTHTQGLSGLARAGQPRVVPCLERQAPAADRAWSVRLRAGSAHHIALDGRRHHRLLRRCPRAPRRSLVVAGVPRLAVGQDRGGADDARPRRPFGVARIARCLDQAVSARRELAEHDDQLLHERRGGRVSARRGDSPCDQWRAQPGRRDAGRVSALLRRARVHAGRVSRADRATSPATDLGAFWRSAIEGTDELDYTDALEVFGLRFKPIATQPGERPKAWLGATTRVDAGRLLVAQVRRHTPAFSAGLNVDDEILAIDEVRVRADRLDERLEQYAPGDRVAMLVARRDRCSRWMSPSGPSHPKVGAWNARLDLDSTRP